MNWSSDSCRRRRKNRAEEKRQFAFGLSDLLPRNCTESCIRSFLYRKDCRCGGGELSQPSVMERIKRDQVTLYYCPLNPSPLNGKVSLCDQTDPCRPVK